ncbi:unnamed protein product [Urochloa humidicola]
MQHPIIDCREERRRNCRAEEGAAGRKKAEREGGGGGRAGAVAGIPHRGPAALRRPWCIFSPLHSSTASRLGRSRRRNPLQPVAALAAAASAAALLAPPLTPPPRLSDVF